MKIAMIRKTYTENKTNNQTQLMKLKLKANNKNKLKGWYQFLTDLESDGGNNLTTIKISHNSF